MVSVTDLRSGTVFEDDGQIYQVLSYEHAKLGRGSANIKVKVKNLRGGAVTEKSFINGAKIKNIQVTKKDLQFLYKDENNAYFMDFQTFEQINIVLKVLTGNEYLKEGEKFSISFLDNEPLFLNLPPKMDLKVAEAGPGVKGNSATNIFKDAVLENGLKTKVPLFIDSGDLIRIDTRTGDYTQKL
jgi:elongation factor P